MKNKPNPFSQCLYFTTNALARHVNRLAEEAFAPTTLCPSGALLLYLITKQHGISPSEAAETMHLAPSTVTRFADGLVNKGYIERRKEGRTSLLYPTPQGEDVIPTVHAAWDRLHTNMCDYVGAEQAAQVSGELAQMAETFGSS